MKEKIIYRTVIRLEVLSEEPIPENMSLSEIEEQCDYGQYSGLHEITSSNQEIKGRDAVEALAKQGSDPLFFNMDEEGNEIEE